MISATDEVGAGGPKAKFDANIDAIRILKHVMAEGRFATPDEQAALVKYVGWGDTAFSKPFGRDYKGYYYDVQDAEKSGWGEQFRALREVLTEDEYTTVARSRLNAHYTSPEVIKAMWRAVRQMGLDSVEHPRVLEPAAGVGHFFGLMPPELAAKSVRSAVELDTLTGNILTQLYQNADVHVTGYQDAPLFKGSYDLVISNVPFAESGFVLDEWQKGPNKWLNKESLHNQFFARAVEHARPGGVVAFITSHFTMDGTRARRLRDYLQESTDFLGAVRLPNTAFKKNAGTEVVTDIIFLRKRIPGEVASGESWSHTERIKPADYTPRTEYSWKTRKTTEIDERPFVNEYYVRHPEMVLGEHSVSGSMYRENEYTVKPAEGELADQLAEALARLPKDIIKLLTAEQRQEGAFAQIGRKPQGPPPPPGTRDKSLYIDPDTNKVMQRDGAGSVEIDFGADKSGGKEDRARRYLTIRGLAHEINDLQLQGGSREAWQAAADRLNEAYDSFVRTYGPLLYEYNTRSYKMDTESSFVFGLERRYTREEHGLLRRSTMVGDKYDWSRLTDEQLDMLKTDIFREPLLRMDEKVESADTPKDALLVTLRERGRIDMDRIGELLATDPDQVRPMLRGLVYDDPTTQGLVLAEEYLSGDVRAKLKAAQEWAALDPRYQENVEALAVVQPEDLPPSVISVRPGASWIPQEDISDFATWLCGSRCEFIYRPTLAEWNMSRSPAYAYGADARRTREYGTSDW
ncbi:MAG TPA: hypothetical protein VNA25_20395, partial [Phycisphaerae bacterium]|nr:hypothetical protein [Phycisphaerae bacterium]